MVGLELSLLAQIVAKVRAQRVRRHQQRNHAIVDVSKCAHDNGGQAHRVRLNRQHVMRVEGQCAQQERCGESAHARTIRANTIGVFEGGEPEHEEGGEIQSKESSTVVNHLVVVVVRWEVVIKWAKEE